MIDATKWAKVIDIMKNEEFLKFMDRLKKIKSPIMRFETLIVEGKTYEALLIREDE